MSRAEGRQIVDTALALLRSHSHAPALEILDLAMQGRHGSSPDFDAPDQAFGNWIDPPSPFAELLRQAFAVDDIGPSAAAHWVADDDGAAIAADWEACVVEPFAKRYRLWDPSSSPLRVSGRPASHAAIR